MDVPEKKFTEMAVTAPQRLLDRVVHRVSLDGGKSGALLERVTLSDGRTFVAKHIDPRRDWVMQATSDAGRVAALWSAGVFAAVPEMIDHAVVTVEPADHGWTVVMRDVSEALYGDRRLSRADARQALAAAHALHCAFADGPPPDGLAPLSQLYRFLSPRTARRLAPVAEVPRLALTGWSRFAGLVPADVAAAVGLVHEHPTAFAEALCSSRCTLVHGDLKVANLGAAGSRTVMLDWGSLTTWAPAAVDLAWFVAINGATIDATCDELLADVRSLTTASQDEPTLRLALLGALAQLGWDKALSATEATDEKLRRRELADLAWWSARAREGIDAWRSVTAVGPVTDV